MAKVISFPSERRPSSQLCKMKVLSDQIDELILRSMQKQDLDPQEILGVLAHRTGNLLGHMENKKDFWSVCKKIIKDQAKIITKNNSTQI